MKKIYLTFICFFVIASVTAQTTHNINDANTIHKAEVEINEISNNTFFSTAKRARPFILNSVITNHQNLQIGDQIQLQLFNDKSFRSVIQSKVTDVNGVTAVRIKLQDFKFAYGYIILSEDSYLITIDIPELNEKYKTKSNRQSNTVYLFQLDESKIELPNCGTTNTSNNDKSRIENIKTKSTTLDLSPTCLTLLGTSDPATIKILVAYTPAAEGWATDINNTISLVIAEANGVSTNNNLGITFLLAHSVKVDYTEVDAGADLNALRSNADFEMNEVHTLRATHEADLVALLTYKPYDGIAGIANLLKTRYGNPQTGFSITQIDFATNSYTFIHELAHNFGADHYRGQNSSEGPNIWTDWSVNDWTSGWRFQGQDDTFFYGTVMTYTSPSLYDDGLPTSTIGYFSDPTYTHDGTPAGDAVEADNARTLKEMKHYIARYSNAAPYCTAEVSTPDALYITNVAICEIDHNSIYSIYSDFTSLATCMEIGEEQELTVQIYNSANTNRLKIWIDWDDDKTFDETTELAYASSTGLTEYTTTITAPSGAILGEKRMRIRIYDPFSPGPNSTSCGKSTFGEIEDYTINIVESHTCATMGLNNFIVENFNYFYNPKLDILTLNSSNSSFSKLELYNLLGQHILSKKLSQTNETINLSWLSNGLYIGKVSINNKVQTIKFLKQ